MEILVYGVVGDSCDGLEAAWLVERISHAPDDITVRINSLGGLVFDGFAIFNALKQSPRRVIVHIDGVAGSIASIIAMAGDEIIMAENAVMMIHKPSDGTYGVATELRSTADRLDMLQAQLVNIYAQRTGMSAEELNPLLDAETWLTAAEALDMNFIDRVAGASTATNMLDPSKFGFRKVPAHPLIAKATSTMTAAAVIPPTQETAMPDGTTAADTTTGTNTDTSTLAIIAATAAQPVNIGDAVATAIAAERARTTTIRNEVSRARLEASFADTLVNEGVTVDVARTRIIDQIATAAPNITNFAPATIPLAQFQARADAMSIAIANRANPRNQLTDDARHFAGRRLVVLARDFLESTGVSTRNMGDVQVAQAVFQYQQPRNAGQHTTADFPALMGNTVGRTLRRAYDLAPQTFKPFVRPATVPDFRPVSRVALSDISRMQAVAEGAEYQYATVGDSSEQYVVGKWGQIIPITWETIVNDDLNAFDRIPMAMGQEAAQVESDVVWAILLSNPNMSDGKTLFHADHGNLGAAAAISIDSLQAGRTRMRTQKSSAGRFLNNAPSFLVAGPLKEQEANQYTSSNYVAAKNGDINPEYNRSLTPIIEGRIVDKTWFLAADPNAQSIDTIEAAHLAGHEGLQTEQRQGFVTDGIEIKGRLVFGAKAIDWRGLDKTQSQ
jgi:ATP-dependent protease ClpP protease subunit